MIEANSALKRQLLRDMDLAAQHAADSSILQRHRDRLLELDAALEEMWLPNGGPALEPVRIREERAHQQRIAEEEPLQ